MRRNAVNVVCRLSQCFLHAFFSLSLHFTHALALSLCYIRVRRSVGRARARLCVPDTVPRRAWLCFLALSLCHLPPLSVLFHYPPILLLLISPRHMCMSPKRCASAQMDAPHPFPLPIRRRSIPVLLPSCYPALPYSYSMSHHAHMYMHICHIRPAFTYVRFMHPPPASSLRPFAPPLRPLHLCLLLIVLCASGFRPCLTLVPDLDYLSFRSRFTVRITCSLSVCVPPPSPPTIVPVRNASKGSFLFSVSSLCLCVSSHFASLGLMSSHRCTLNAAFVCSWLTNSITNTVTEFLV